MNDYFEYVIPKTRDIKHLYAKPYRFKDNIRKEVDYIFTHPKFIHRQLYISNSNEWSSNKMLISAYYITKYYLDYPIQYNYTYENAMPHIIVSMWKVFIQPLAAKHKTKHYRYPLKTMLPIVHDRLTDILLKTVSTNDLYTCPSQIIDDKIKLNRVRPYTEKELDYFDSL